MKSEVVQEAFAGIPGKVGPLAQRSMVTEWQEIPLTAVQEVLGDKAGALWPKIEEVFTNYGSVLSVPVVSLLMYAEEASKLEEYLAKLETYYQSDIAYQHPDLRGRLIIAPAEKNRSLMFVESLIYELKPELFKTA